MGTFHNDYDIFSENETWYLVKSNGIYVEDGKKEKLMNFKEGDELIIQKITRDSGYGTAFVTINGHKTRLSLDEVYGMVME